MTPLFEDAKPRTQEEFAQALRLRDAEYFEAMAFNYGALEVLRGRLAEARAEGGGADRFLLELTLVELMGAAELRLELEKWDLGHYAESLLYLLWCEGAPV